MTERAPGRRRNRTPMAMCGIGCTYTVLLSMLVFAVIFATTGSYKVDIPPPKPLPAVNGFYDYVVAGQMLAASGGTRRMYASGGGRPILSVERLVVSRNTAALVRLRSAFGKQCRVPPARSWSLPLPYLASCRELARLLSAQADVRGADGDWSGSFDAGVDAVHLGCDLERGGNTTHSMSGMAFQSIGQRPMERAIEHLEASACGKLAERLQTILLSRQTQREMYMEERNVSLTILQNEIDARFFMDPGTAEEQPNSFEMSISRMHWHLLRDRTIREVEAYANMTLREMSKPIPQRRTIPEPSSQLAGMLAPAAARFCLAYDRCDARNRIILVALAIRRFRLENGILPAKLDELELKTRLLRDPFSGAELVYQRGIDDYLLYSVGPDGKDDGGVPLDGNADEWLRGDLGIREFRSEAYKSKLHYGYDRVPHMKLPVLKKGAPPLGTYVPPIDDGASMGGGSMSAH